MAEIKKVRIAIDRGGTFTDCFATWQHNEVKDGSWQGCSLSLKLLSQDPTHYKDAPAEGIRRLLSKIYKKEIPRTEPLNLSDLESVRMGTTVATNALLERQGAPMALLTTRGFKDLLKIGTQARPEIFDLSAKRPDLLYRKVIEIDERLVPISEENKDKQGDICEVVQGLSGEWIKVLQKPERDQVRSELLALRELGIDALAICFLHSYLYPEHERLVGEMAHELGFSQVTLSSDLTSMVKAVPRAHSACADAYLTPHIRAYLDSFASHFKGSTKDFDQKLLFMQSDGGLSPMPRFSGLRAILSGPAGGVVGCARTSYDSNYPLPVIGFDMGGTSTDVSRYDGAYRHIFETTTAGVAIQAPQLEILTVAAGGGSKLTFRDGLFHVGPQSVGAHPGPVCYRKGGSLAITDANLALGRLQPDLFPSIFGPEEDQPLDLESTLDAFKKLSDGMRQQSMDMELDAIAHGFVSVANETMCRPIRALTESKGWDTSKHSLCSFGGAGGQHACAIADSLGIETVLIHRHASILSAYGLSLAEVVRETQEPAATHLEPENYEKLINRIEVLKKKTIETLSNEGIEEVHLQTFLNLRYVGTDCALMIKCPSDGVSDCLDVFLKAHQQEFGFLLPNRGVIVDDIRIRGSSDSSQTLPSAYSDLEKLSRTTPTSNISRSVYFSGGRVDTPIYFLNDMASGATVKGPALVTEPNSTVVVEPGWEVCVTDSHLVLKRHSDIKKSLLSNIDIDPVRLAIFANRFMGIAEQMGHTLQHTAVSTNIKERLDFSCALFGPDGGLVANAPHIPVHLGSLSFAVQFQMRHYKELESSGNGLKEGDVIVTNHPQAGGSHLPDITVITPVFFEGKIVFFVASRGHHADIGGILPGSMPPHSVHLKEEGAAILSFKLVEGGHFQTEGITDLLMSPQDTPGCSGTRRLQDNISDLHAQVAANNKGIQLVKQLIEECGLDVVHAYMKYIRDNAENAVRRLLANRVPSGQDTIKLKAEDRMDDGSPICLEVNIDKSGSAIFDFEGTGTEVRANFNAPLAVTHSAILYCLRCLVGVDIPLNAGCLSPLNIIVAPGCLLNPSPEAAVVGGNVTTSQRVCDVVLQAFKACGASQGCCNNLTFGTSQWGYYETIAGGSGAGPNWHGCSGTHTHMTNTRITDPEILERRYPVLLRQFSLREGSGGHGSFKGGNGVVREVEFLEPMQVSILSERRALAPYGMLDGQPGLRGVNLYCSNSQGGPTTIPFGWKGGALPGYISIGGRATINVESHDRILIITPGGGGYGSSIST